MVRYKKRNPVTVNAEQFWPGKEPWPEGVYPGDVSYRDIRFFIGLTDRVARINSGDWVVILWDGNKVLYKDQEFQQVYEKVVGE